MHPTLKHITQLLKGRLARNIYFWLPFAGTKFLAVSEFEPYPHAWYHGLLLLTLSVFAVMAYTNNLVLIPYLFMRKKKWLYFLTVIPLTWVVSFFYTWFMKYILAQLPQIRIIQISVVAPRLTPDLSVDSVLAQMESVSVVFYIWMFGFGAVWFLNYYIQRDRQLTEALQKQTETELSFLKSQINPHFLFNTLNNLYGLSLKKSDETPEAILKLSSVLRYVLYESDVPQISFEKEKEAIEAYIDIEMLRLPENGMVQCSVLADRPASIPPLLWLPVLENIFKHSHATIQEDLLIDFRFTLKENVLHIYSKNSARGNGHQHENKKPGGIGLANLRKRLELLFPGKFTFTTGFENGFYIVDLQIKLT